MRSEKTLFTLLLLLVSLFDLTPHAAAQPPGEISARALDALLQDYAFRSLNRPRTGVAYNAVLPVNITGVGVSAMRVRSGSLRARGVRSYGEFRIPIGVVEQPYAKRIVLVYHSLGNWSSLFYPLPGFDYVAPVLGLLAYDGSNLTATDLPELEIRALKKPITIEFPENDDIIEGGSGSSPYSPKCVFFDLHGSVDFEDVLPGNVCKMFKQGHCSVVVESEALAPAPSAAGQSSYGRGGGKSKGWTILWSLIGVLIFLGFLALLVLRVKKYQNERSKKKEKRRSELGTDRGEAVQITSFENLRAPFATGTRTQPVLEDHYVP
ncbi:uncharacterized protein LOC133788258 [Humulus lupulus]|uniref:uncharacterized protein LOC133788258 n=1 Tax=Humulus lupulus TaxID=3486 RepID=UPI002B40F4BB|nr:uncharacterized protein LOC133788258 [Humulus lupulus]